MAQRHEIYVCELCGNMVEVLGGGDGELVCCGQAMTLQKENTVEASKEKHIPSVKEENGQLIIQVGTVLHPMEPNHYIEWVELIAGDKIKRVYFKAGTEPKAEFCKPSGSYTVRAFCNMHGLWKAE
ncbi:MAG: desulfoferrodoxin [Thermoguttaceae bacterium]